MSLKVRKNGQWVTIGVGEKGFKGDKGISGDKGDKGIDGVVGFKGEKGEKGFKGDSIKGQKGQRGAQGNDGDSVKGQKGDKGEIGEKGFKGEVGFKGEQGVGEKGIPGDVAEKGQKGQEGEKGLPEKGQKGEDNSAKGEKGGKGEAVKGDKGEFKGQKGQQGFKGEKGDVVLKGEKGSAGSILAAGSDKQVQFNDNNTLAGADGLEFTKLTSSIDANALQLKPSSIDSDNFGKGSISIISKDDVNNVPYNIIQLSTDGGVEIMRRRDTNPIGGPYIDFTSQLRSDNTTGVDQDARIQMDYSFDDSTSSIDPTNDNYSAILFYTGGNGIYNGDNLNGRVTEKIRIGKFGEIGIAAGGDLYDPTQNPPIITNNRTDVQKYGSAGQVLKSGGKGASVYWDNESGGSGGGGGNSESYISSLSGKNEVEFTNIPSWATKITLLGENVLLPEPSGNIQAIGTLLEFGGNNNYLGQNAYTNMTSFIAKATDGSSGYGISEHDNTPYSPYILLNSSVDGIGPVLSQIHFTFEKVKNQNKWVYSGSTANRKGDPSADTEDLKFLNEFSGSFTATEAITKLKFSSFQGSTFPAINLTGGSLTVIYESGSGGSGGGSGGGPSDKIEEGNTKAEVVDTNGDGHFFVQTENEERLRIDKDGNMGLGINNPTSLLHIKTLGNGTASGGTNQLITLNSGTSQRNNWIGIKDADNLILAADNDNQGNDSTIRFWIDGNERLRIASAGQLGLSGENYGVSGQVLTSGGPNAAPSWEDASGGGGGASSLVGTIVAWSGSISNIPSDYFLCDGRELDKTTESELFAIMGVMHNVGGEPSNIFRIPDLRDKFIVGAHSDSIGTTYPQLQPASKGGQKDAIVPDHTHPTSVDNGRLFHQGGQNNSIPFGGPGQYPGTVFVMNNPTDGEPVTNKNLPPYYALCYIIRHTASGGSGGGGGGSSFVLLPEKSTTGVEVEFTGIPADAQEITVMFKGVSASGSNDVVVQLGTSSGYITSGYVSNSENTQGTTHVASNTTNNAGFVIFADSDNTELHGSMIINKASSNSYTEIGEFRRGNSAGAHARGSLSSVSGTVDRLKIFLNGNNTFDEGIVSVSYKTSGSGGSGSGGITIEDEGTALANIATTLNFVGDGVVASGTGSTKTITISGGGGGGGGSSSSLPVNAQTAPYTLVSDDTGKLVTTTSGNITVPEGQFNAGDAITIANLSNASISVVQSSNVLLYMTGTTVTGNRSLAAKGLCTIICVSSNQFFVSGGGVT